MTVKSCGREDVLVPRRRSVGSNAAMTARVRAQILAEHAPENTMDDPGEIARFYDRCSDLMRELLEIGRAHV